MARRVKTHTRTSPPVYCKYTHSHFLNTVTFINTCMSQIPMSMSTLNGSTTQSSSRTVIPESALASWHTHGRFNLFSHTQILSYFIVELYIRKIHEAHTHLSCLLLAVSVFEMAHCVLLILLCHVRYRDISFTLFGHH